MGIRSLLDKYSAVSTLVAVGLLTLAVATVVRGFTSTGDKNVADRTQYYFVDPDSGKLLTQPSQVSPAFVSGKEVFRAYVFSCASCSDASSLFVAYMEKLTQERIAAEARMRSGLAPGEDLRPAAKEELRSLRGQFVSAVSPVDWVEPDDSRAQAIFTAFQGKCPSGTATPCVPGQQ